MQERKLLSVPTTMRTSVLLLMLPCVTSFSHQVLVGESSVEISGSCIRRQGSEWYECSMCPTIDFSLHGCSLVCYKTIRTLRYSNGAVDTEEEVAC
uniref:AlNc14C2452G13241 protein n=1 Tax=Albugo laibachii Nc14 TaxID=890382 RepID=F0X2Y2_9STRA|nr:AlNc14C2452G13241 [Albugo laibachii Nc14]|eukprot:CCA28345.1 AlNc14C2452G13241 [Albugo laibachii Nc14]